MGMFGPKRIYYSISSEKDSRFNFEGDYKGFVMSGIPDFRKRKDSQTGGGTPDQSP